jgi:hypothetical protein
VGTASRTRALTPWPACQRPKPLALGPLGQRSLPPLLLMALALLVSRAYVVGVWSPPSDSDRTARTMDNASRTRALTPLAPLVSRARARPRDLISVVGF